MPVVKIELLAGKDYKTLIKIRDLVMDALVGVLRLPQHDRNARIIEYQPGFFQTKPPYEVLIEISMFKGRTKETKKKLFTEIVSSLEFNGLFEKKNVLIIINEQPRENWGIRGGFPAHEVDLGFEVEV